MRRLCIIATLIPSLLIASAPAQADAASSRSKQARSAIARTHVKATPGQGAQRSRVTGAQKFTYGRT